MRAALPFYAPTRRERTIRRAGPYPGLIMIPSVLLLTTSVFYIAYMHIAGHYQEHESLIIDTHGADVVDSVWELLDFTYRTHGLQATLLERDFNLPPLPELLREVDMIRYYQHRREQNHSQRQFA